MARRTTVISTVNIDGIYLSVIVAWAVNISELSVKYRRIYSSVISTINIDGIYPSVIVAWVVMFLQLSVKYRRLDSICKVVGIDLKYFFKNIY